MRDTSTFEYVAAKIENEGFDYCFRYYSFFEEVEDDEFHKLRQAYMEAANSLEKYVEDKVKENDK